MEYDNTNRGSLFKNDRKDDAKFPDYIKNKNADSSLDKKPVKSKEFFNDSDIPF
jgi:hypothetical protein